MTWRKSSHSNPNGACVEAGNGPGVIGVRDSTLGESGLVLILSPDTWTRFLARFGSAG